MENYYDLTEGQSSTFKGIGDQQSHTVYRASNGKKMKVTVYFKHEKHSLWP